MIKGRVAVSGAHEDTAHGLEQRRYREAEPSIRRPSRRDLISISCTPIIPTPTEDVSATITDYGIRFTSSIGKGNIFASQFHPEKSQGMGLKLLRNFVSLCA